MKLTITNFVRLVLAMLFFGTASLQAQTNLALTATPNHSGGGVTIYGPTNYNDGVNVSGTFGWVSTAGNPCTNGCWIEYTWSSPVTAGKIVYFPDALTTRTMTGGTVQYWNGSTYVNHYTFSGLTPASTMTLQFPAVTTTRLRIVSITTTGSQASNPSIREIQVFATFAQDIGVAEIQRNICSGTSPVNVRLVNGGSRRLDSFTCGWSVNGTFQNQFRVNSSPINVGSSAWINYGNYNFVGGNTYTIRAWVTRPNLIVKDSNAANDTLSFTFKVFDKPNKPSVKNQVQCGAGFPVLKGSAGTGNTLLWSIPGNNELEIIAEGDSTTYNKKYFPVTTLKFNARGFNGQADTNKSTLNQTWSFTGGAANYDKGVMWTMVPKKDILVNQFDAYMMDPVAATYSIEVWYKRGTWSGFENSQGSWTLAGTTSATISAAGNVIPLKFNTLLLRQDTTYAFAYIIKNASTNARSCAVNVGNMTSPNSNEFLHVFPGVLHYNPWGSRITATGFRPDLNVIYRFGCFGDSSQSTITFKPSPVGASLEKGTPFTTTRPNSAGKLGNPDVVAARDTITYSFTPPTGYNNTDYNSTWTITSVVLRTKNGYNVPASRYTFNAPSGSNNATFQFRPNSLLTDSTLYLYFVAKDLGPWFCDSVIQRVIFVAPRGVPNFTFQPTICDGDPVLFENKSTVSTGNLLYHWDFTTGDTSDALNPVYKFPTFGTYKVKLTLTTTPWGYKTDTTINVVVREIPNVKFDKVNACEGKAIQLINKTTLTVPGSISYEWIMGDNSPNKYTTNVSHTYSKPGAYLVTLKANANGCSNEFSSNVYQFAKPVAAYIAPTGLLCSGTEVPFINNSTISDGLAGSYWNFGDGELSTDENPMHAFPGEGAFSVKLKMVSEFGCMDSVSKTVNIKEKPVVGFTYNKACDLSATTFSNITTHLPANTPTYTWNFGDGTQSGVKDPVKNWSSLGPKKVKLLCNLSNGCSDSAVQTLTVLPQPSVGFSIQDACSGEIVGITNSTSVNQGDVQYFWNLGDGSTSTDQVPRKSYSVTNTKTYSVTLRASVVGGCEDSVTKSVTISESPNCQFTVTPEWTLGGRGFKYAANNTSYPFYQWQFGEGGSASNASGNYQYVYNGTFKVTLVARNSVGCECSSSQDVFVDNRVSVQMPDGLAFRVYPTLTSGMVTIESNKGETSGMIQVLDMAGKAVRSFSFANLASQTINLSDLSAGVYNLNIVSASGNGTVRLMIQK